MTELEDRLRDHPEDTATWLVYGDWLLQRDDPRGALIQLEHRLATARQPATIQQEIDTLVAKHQPAWKAALPRELDVVGWLHGFPSTIAVPLDADAPARVERVLAMPESMFVRGLRFVAKSPRKRETDETDDETDDDDHDDDSDEFMDEVPLLEMPRLANLSLGRIVRLELPYLRIGPAGATSLASLDGIERLHVLDLRYSAIGDDGLAALAPKLRDVRELYLQRSDIGADGVAALASAALPALVRLDLRYNGIGVEGARSLAASPLLGRLEQLGLYGDDVTQAGAQVLAASPLAMPLRRIWRAR